MDYIYTLHIEDVERPFTDFSGSGRRLLFHVPHDVISNNEKFEASLEVSHMCTNGVSTSHFTLSKHITLFIVLVTCKIL